MKTEKTSLEKLEEKIAIMRLTHEIEERVSIDLDGIKTMVCGVGRNTFISISAKDRLDFQKIISVYPPTEETHHITGSSVDETIDYPFKIDIENPCQITQYSNFKLKIWYKAKDFDVWINLPIDEVKEFIQSSQRPITSSEHHCFTGVAYASLKKMTVKKMTWGPLKKIGWYGGNETLIDHFGIENVLNKLNSPLNK